MFDKYFVKSGPSHLSASVNVKEQRAPTDKSVQLLKEFEAAAAKKVRDVIVVDGNELKGKIAIVESDPMTLSSIVYFTFKLNGIEYEISETFKPGLLPSPDELVRKLYENVAKAVAERLIQELDKTQIHDYINWYRPKYE